MSLIAESQVEELSTSLPTSPPQEAAEGDEVSPQPPSLQIRQTQSPQLLLDISSSPGISSVPLLWGHPRFFTSFNAGAQTRIQGKAIWSLKDTHSLLVAAICLLRGKGGIFIPGDRLHIKLLLSFAKKREEKQMLL